MTVYEFYSRDTAGVHLVGMLPERRKDPRRITQKSIMRWGREIAGPLVDLSTLFFIEIKIDDKSGEFSYPDGFSDAQWQ